MFAIFHFFSECMRKKCNKMNKKCVLFIFICVLIELSNGSNDRFAYGVVESSLYDVNNPRYIQPSDSFRFLYFCLFVCISVFSICLYVYLSVCLSIWLSVYLSVYLSIYEFVYLTEFLSKLFGPRKISFRVISL